MARKLVNKRLTHACMDFYHFYEWQYNLKFKLIKCLAVVVIVEK